MFLGQIQGRAFSGDVWLLAKYWKETRLLQPGWGNAVPSRWVNTQAQDFRKRHPEEEHVEELIQLVTHTLNACGYRGKMDFNIMGVQSLRMEIK